MSRVTIEDCLRRVQGRFVLVHGAVARARQLRAGDVPLVHSPKNEDIVIALREIAAGKIKIKREESEGGGDK